MRDKYLEILVTAMVGLYKCNSTGRIDEYIKRINESANLDITVEEVKERASRIIRSLELNRR